VRSKKKKIHRRKCIWWLAFSFHQLIWLLSSLLLLMTSVALDYGQDLHFDVAVATNEK
jgi:hypothetical protein